MFKLNVFVCALAVCLTPLAARAQESWTQRASLHQARFAHAAVTMADGRVFVVAGLAPAGAGTFAERHLAQAEIYDPSTDVWTAVAPMNAARQVPNAILLEDGRVLVEGGAIPAVDPTDPTLAFNASTGDVEIYDPASNTWTTAAPLLFPAAGDRAVRLADGRILSAGGGGFFKDPPDVQLTHAAAEIYEPSTNTWSAAAPMHSPRVQHAIALMQDGRVLVAGGRQESPFFNFWSTAEAYDPSLDTWTLLAPMPVVLTRATAATLADGRVVVVGLQGAVVYDPAADTWATIASGPSYQDVQPLADGGALLISATSAVATGVVENVYRLDAASLALSLTDAVPAPTLQTFPSVGVVLADDAILMTGGLEREIGGPNVSSARVTRYGAAQPGYTTTGSSITVDVPPVSMTFSSVTFPGLTLVASIPDPVAPSGFQVGDPSVSYGITTTASFSGEVTICIGYADVTFPGTPSFLHFEGGAWVDRTTSVDAANQIVCGTVSNLSPFALFARVTAGGLKGGGQLIAGTKRFEFELHVSRSEAGAVTGRLRLASAFASDAVTGASFSADGRTATFNGIGVWNGAAGYTFEATATDGGEPGRGRDRLAFTIRDPNGSVVASADGTINAGNIH